MAKNDSDGYPIGNQDPGKRGFGRRPERDSGGNDRSGKTPAKRGGKPGYGDVTKNPRKD